MTIIILNKFNVRRLTTFILAVSLIVSFSINSMAFAGNPISEATEQFIFNDKVFDISFSQDGSIRTAVIHENDGKTTTILKMDKETGIVTHNGVPIREEVISTQLLKENNLLLSSKSNWTTPTVTVTALSFAAFSTTAIIGYLSLKYGVPPAEAAYIASLIVGAGGFLYVKSVLQLNYVDYAPKVGYRLTESLHLTRNATGNSLFTRTTTGSR